MRSELGAVVVDFISGKRGVPAAIGARRARLRSGDTGPHTPGDTERIGRPATRPHGSDSMSPARPDAAGVIPRRLSWSRRLSRSLVCRVFRSADIIVDGDRPWDIHVHDERAFGAMLTTGSLGFGEGYMFEWWSTEDLEELTFRLSRSGLNSLSRFLPLQVLAFIGANIVNRQTVVGSRRVAERHYDLGNDLFFGFLGKYKNYSGAYFEGTNALDAAQLNKMELICRRLRLREGDHLLDVGGGWGELAHYAASHFGCRVTSVNISDEQIRYARTLCDGLPVEVRKCDYRDVAGEFNKIAVIAMLTHVGPKNYQTFMTTMSSCLDKDGLMLVETLCGRWAKTDLDPWTEKYIFPGGVVPSLNQITRASAKLFATRELEEFGRYYVPTLRAWHANLTSSWPTVGSEYSETTRRMLEYFFLSVAGAFRAGHLKYWHILMAKA
jgi:cyclopropane-fatty-acyl-phospholipid synthase